MPIGLFLILLLQSPLARASEIPHLCRELAKGDPGEARKCEAHVAFFETTPALIRACTKFQASVDFRMRCLKSGADENVLSLCQGTGWNLPDVFTCLRAAPDYDVLRACQKMSPAEADQVRCIRQGRESVQVTSCTDLLPDAPTRLHCLEKPFSHLEIRRCEVDYRSTRDRVDCLDETVAEREQLPGGWDRSLASRPGRAQK